MASAPLRPSNTKRRPTVLVTDSRDQRLRPESLRKSSIRFVSVDNVLSSSSEIPSALQRNPLPTSRRNPLLNIQQSRRPSDTSLKNTKLVGQTNIPVRSSKITEKLVLLPDPEEAQTPPKGWDFDDDNNAAPLRDDEELQRSEASPDSAPRKSYAERLPKSRRAEKLPRVSAFCTANAYRLQAVSTFLREQHRARTKLYDECLYAAYHLPLLPGNEGNRVKSSPALKSPGGKTVLDAQIERSERRDYHEEYFQTSSSERGGGGYGGDDGEMVGDEDSRQQGYGPGDSSRDGEDLIYSPNTDRRGEHLTRPMSPELPDDTDVMAFAEMFLFSYGVVVFWNFTERQERDILADLTFAVTPLGTPLLLQPMKEDEYESEEFHFEYSPKTTKPRIYNDMITLRSGDHMIKLAMSHAIAQSTKLSMFEERMAMTMREVEHIPRHLALTGTLGMKREEVLRMSGKLFKLRVDVNLSSNTLDTPEFFWDSEPALHPLYMAVREYLEIKQRVLVVNEKCRVFLDLTAILADSIADHNMSRITWIIIILIILSIFVTLGEVTLRFSILKGKA